MSDALNDWNTRMPDTSGIAPLCHDLGRQGFDVHTVEIILNGQSGKFDVNVSYTDEHLEDHYLEMELDSNGSIERV